jgi:hypothetical protein
MKQVMPLRPRLRSSEAATITAPAKAAEVMKRFEPLMT